MKFHHTIMIGLFVLAPVFLRSGHFGRQWLRSQTAGY